MDSSLLPTKHKKSGDDNMIPMINIVFLLLIFFMIAGQIQARSNSQIRLPVSDLGVKAEPDVVQLELDHNNRLTYNGDEIGPQELASRLGNTVAHQHRISLRADKSLSAIELDTVLQVVRQHGTANVTLISTELGAP